MRRSAVSPLPYLMILPSIALALWIIGYPIWDVTRTSLHVVNRFGQLRGFAGAANFEALLADPIFQGAFWRTIADPTDPRAVVIDRHAIDIATGRVLGDKVRGLLLSRAGAYDEVCDAYRRAARILSREFGTDLSPAAVQATTWVHWRREYAALYAA